MHPSNRVGAAQGTSRHNLMQPSSYSAAVSKPAWISSSETVCVSSASTSLRKRICEVNRLGNLGAAPGVGSHMRLLSSISTASGKSISGSGKQLVIIVMFFLRPTKCQDCANK